MKIPRMYFDFSLPDSYLRASYWLIIISWLFSETVFVFCIHFMSYIEGCTSLYPSLFSKYLRNGHVFFYDCFCFLIRQWPWIHSWQITQQPPFELLTGVQYRWRILEINIETNLISMTHVVIRNYQL